MSKLLMNFAKWLYLKTSLKSLRFFYYRIFCYIVKNFKIKVSIDQINYKLDLGESIDLGLYLGRYELDMVQAIKKICNSGFIVLDIGANIGAHALLLAKIVGESGRVYSFEPTDYAYKKLVYNISLNKFNNIFPIQAVLSDKNLLQQRINFRSSWCTDGTRKDYPCLVDFYSLDAWCEKHSVNKIDLIKLDVDGNEFTVLKGALSMLSKTKPVILMEVWGPNFSDPLRNPFNLLQECGYGFFHIDTNEEYESIDQLKSLVFVDGKLIDYSFQIVAKYKSKGEFY